MNQDTARLIVWIIVGCGAVYLLHKFVGIGRILEQLLAMALFFAAIAGVLVLVVWLFGGFG